MEQHFAAFFPVFRLNGLLFGIQQFPDFLKTLPGNFLIISPLEIFSRMASFQTGYFQLSIFWNVQTAVQGISIPFCSKHF